ncbi:MAG: sensor signal transduction histidine kinase [Myxococcales bacterium]|nr:sensor signal transduction histidine kinase [Myxococcales bacterium]
MSDQAVSAQLSAVGSDLEQQLRMERKKVAAVRELGKVLGATLDLDRLLVVLLEKVTDLLDAERATIYLVTDEGTHLESKIAQGGAINTIRLKTGEGIAGWVAQSAATVNIPDAYADPRFNQSFDKSSGFRTRSILCMPMPDHKGRTIGVVQVLNKRLGPFSGDDEALLATVAAHAGIAIENSKLYLSVLGKNTALLSTQDQLRQRIAELDLLFEIEREASAAIDLDELLSTLLARAIQLVGVEAGSILLRERNSGELFFRTAQGQSADSLKRVKLPAGEGIVGWVALHKAPLLVNDPGHDARHDLFIAEKIGVPARNILAVPLLPPYAPGDDELTSLGAIELVNKRGGTAGFEDGDLRLLTLIAGQVSRAITIARNREERLHSERLASIGQMMGGVLHDLKTPMTIVSGYAQLMAQCDDAAQRSGYADLILKQFDLMSAMTRELLQFARGQSELLVRKVYLQKWIPEMRAQLEREFAGKKIDLLVEERYKGAAWFDENKMFRLIHNLARNASQAMEAGGTFRIVIDTDGPELTLIFSDTGGGIPEAMQGRVFAAFATSGKPDGTGLGLAIVKKIVDEHQGRISYESKRGEGTTFRVALPLARPA